MDKNQQDGSNDQSNSILSQTHNRDKGKDKDTSPSLTTAATSTTSASQAIGSRIVSSAARLASGLITTSASPAGINKAIPGGKATTSSAGPSTSERLVVTEDLHASLSRPSTLSQHHQTREHRFKPSDTEVHSAQQEAAFSSFLDDVPVLEPPASLSPALETDDVRATKLDARTSFTVPLGSAGTQSEAPPPVHDGLDVVRLLDSDACDEVMAFNSEDEPNLTPEARESLWSALFEKNQCSTSAESIDWTNLLNFFPSYVVPSSGNIPTGTEHDRSIHLGVCETDEAQRQWEEQWALVLTRYTDEVWGELSSLVQVARREVRAGEFASDAGTVSLELPALRRLQQILGQIRGY